MEVNVSQVDVSKTVNGMEDNEKEVKDAIKNKLWNYSFTVNVLQEANEIINEW